MSTEFPFVQVPEELRVVVGEMIPKTKIYRKTGPAEEDGYWFDVLTERFGPLVSPGGVSMFAPVSRAAVHKRMKEGKLTCFLYDITYRKRNFFGSSKEVRVRDMAYVPVSECKAWGKEIMERAIEKQFVTRRELEGDKPDWHGQFLQPDSRWEKHRAHRTKGQKS